MEEKTDDRTPRAVQACHELLAWLIPLLDQFPRSRRFTLGERLESGLLVVLEALVEAAYSRDKRAALARVRSKISIARHRRIRLLKVSVKDRQQVGGF
jgi:hypothetical protein